MTEKTTLTCFHCSASFTRKDNLVRHIKNFHLNPKINKKNVKVKVRRIVCPLCNVIIPGKFSNFHHHLTLIHNVNLEQQCVTFNSFSEFQTWKLEEENKTMSKFVKRRREYTRKNGSTVGYYVCHRSFHFKCTKKRKTSRRKNRGSNKIGYACSANMKVTKTNQQITVNYCNSHVGHCCEVGRLTLNAEEKAELAGKMKQGVPLSRVLDDIREEEPTTIKRIHLTDRNDLHNIKKTYGINCPLRYDNNDPTSVAVFIEKMKMNEKGNPIIFFKDQQTELESFEKKDFILIMMSEFQKEMFVKYGHRCVCIDGTHGLNEYKFILYTIVVLDEFDNGIPVAFCFSNRGTLQLYTLFFEKVKESLGKTITTKIFMSDGEVTFYTAWAAVMGSAERQLLCLWHLYKTWNQHFPKIDDLNKRKLVKKTLYAVAAEPNVENFCQEYKNFLKQLEEDEDTVKFYKYLNDYYTKNTESWAACYRSHAVIQTNMHLESFHKTIKYHYLNGKRCSRLDNTIYQLFRYLRDKKYDHLIKLAKEKPTKKSKAIRESHAKSADYINSVEIIDNGKYQVKDYEVTLQQPEPCCFHVCKECKICICMYVCSCRDSQINRNMCKHIHACVQKDEEINQELADDENCNSLSVVPTNSDIPTNSVTENSNQNLLLESYHFGDEILPTVQRESLDDAKVDLIARCNVISGYLSNRSVKKESIDIVRKLLDRATAVLMEEENSEKEKRSNPVNTNSKIEKQTYLTINTQKLEPLSPFCADCTAVFGFCE
ncbi:uncharacterized protein LOC135834080 [Planococcus citri]|uniref:uncharacterized protein LOC135834080 n=2 Tax=Planococcus citri TaxID=170843 RepID=UPI0031F99A71